MYFGEVTVPAVQLEEFLLFSKELEIEGVEERFQYKTVSHKTNDDLEIIEQEKVNDYQALEDTLLLENVSIEDDFLLNQFMEEFDSFENYFPCGVCEYYSDSEQILKKHISEKHEDLVKNETKDLKGKLNLELVNIKKMKIALKKKIKEKKGKLQIIEENIGKNKNNLDIKNLWKQKEKLLAELNDLSPLAL